MDNIVIDNIFHEEDEITTDEFNQLVIKRIRQHPGWYVSGDEERELKSVGDEFSDSGMLLESFYRSPDHDFNYHSNINEIANLIFQKILSCLSINFIEIEPVRFLWNYYNRSSTGVVHRDMSEETDGNFCSIVYHLNDCDGSTVIEDEFIKSKSGQCVLFDSKKIHYGTGPSKYPNRYCLNIVFKYKEII